MNPSKTNPIRALSAMFSFFPLLALAAAATSFARAQSVDVPYGYGNVECNNASSYPFGRGTAACRVQYIYDTSNFTLVGVNHPILIHTVQFRCNGGGVNAGGTYANVNYRLGVANADYAALSTSFDGNYLGSAPPFQPAGPISAATGAGTTPNNHYVVLSITPFLYDPGLGHDLIIEIRFPSGSFTGSAGNTAAAPVDLHFGAGDARGARVFTTLDTAATGVFQPSAAHALKFLYLVPPGVAFASSRGIGCGNPALALEATGRPILGTTLPLVTSNVPASAVLSASIMSLLPYSPGLSLTGLGMPGCFQYVGLDAVVVLLGTPSVTRNLVVPADPTFNGMGVFNQSVSLVPGVNPLGAITSNAMTLVLGFL